MRRITRSSPRSCPCTTRSTPGASDRAAHEPGPVTLALCGFVDLPPHAAGGFDHADVHLPSGRVFVAHTANGAIDVVDGNQLRCECSVGGCPKASGVLCGQPDGELVFAAARGAGKILVLDSLSCEV